MNTPLRYLLPLLLLAPLAATAGIEQGAEALAAFRDTRSATPPYSTLETAYREYADALRNATPRSDEYRQAHTALLEIFPLLRQGAYHYAQLGDQNMVLRFAACYIDLSLLPGMLEDHLNESPGYPILANLAATNIYNRDDYQNAILYFQAYLSSGDTQNRETAFEGLARSYYELKNYDNAIYIAGQGLTYFPRNWNMAIIGTEACGRSGNDQKMESFLLKALAIDPSHAGLLEYQGKLYERLGRYSEAAGVFSSLYAANPTSLDFACHAAFDCYNTGVAMLSSGVGETEAAGWFSRAIPMLTEILDNSPYAVNVAHALAVCYSRTGDKDRLTKANSTLTALRVPEVSASTTPLPEKDYMPTANFNPVAATVPDAGADRMLSDVDINIPAASGSRPDTYVVVFGNENYKYFSDVAYARRDGETFAEYCRTTLGVPADNIRERYDATLTELREPLKYLSEKTRMNPGELDIIIYYAGHGVPDVSNGTAHLLPTDASGTDFESCLQLDRLYDMLDDMPARSVTVFLDACFSGATRGNEMLFAERFVEYEVEDVVTKGNTVVFSATTGKQTAMAYDDKGHGFFTYYLLKNLQESAGSITLGELADRLPKEVDNKAYDKKNKHQQPTVKASPALGDSWRTRRL